jgi:nucleotide-binding universal stress UspA family protein
MFITILWATDGSDQADRALDYAAEIAGHEHAQLHVVHVVEKLVGGRTTGQDAHLDEDDVVAKVKAQTARIASQHEITPTVHVAAEASGHVAGRIADVAEEAGADLIVVGTRGRSALGGLVLGSVTQRLLHVAGCPVLAVPPTRVAGERQPDALPAAG